MHLHFITDRAHNFVNNYLYGMVWTQQTVIKFLKKKLADISYFEYPIPIQVFLEDINHTKHAHDRLKNICKCLAFGFNFVHWYVFAFFHSQFHQQLSWWNGLDSPKVIKNLNISYPISGLLYTPTHPMCKF